MAHRLLSSDKNPPGTSASCSVRWRHSELQVVLKSWAIPLTSLWKAASESEDGGFLIRTDFSEGNGPWACSDEVLSSRWWGLFLAAHWPAVWGALLPTCGLINCPLGPGHFLWDRCPSLRPLLRPVRSVCCPTESWSEELNPSNERPNCFTGVFFPANTLALLTLMDWQFFKDQTKQNLEEYEIL